jgi:hypothetical protein
LNSEAERWQQDLLEDGNRTGLRRLYRMDDDQSLPSIAVRLTPEMEAPRNGTRPVRTLAMTELPTETVGETPFQTAVV